MCCKWIFANFHSYSIVMFVTQDWVEICLTYSGPVFENNKRFHWYEQTCGMTSDISIMWKIPWNSVRACVFSAVPCVFSCVAYKSIVRKAAFSRGLLYPGTFHDCVNYFHNFSCRPARSYYIFTIMGSHYSLSVHRHAPACIIIDFNAPSIVAMRSMQISRRICYLANPLCGIYGIIYVTIKVVSITLARKNIFGDAHMNVFPSP